MTRTLTTVALLLSMTACTEPANNFGKLLPDDRLLVDMPTNPGSSARSATGDASEYQALTAEVTVELNTLIGEVLSSIDYVTSFDATWTDNYQRALWGPWEEDGLNGRLWVEEADDGSYTWALEGKAVEAGEDGWVALVAGEIDAGASEQTNSGRFVFDFGAITPLAEVDDIASGFFYVDYAIDGQVVDAEAAFEDFVSTDGETADAAYVYGSDSEGAGYMDLAVLTQAVGGPEPEVHLVRSRWTPEGDGRADVYLTEGDLGPLVYTLTECWDSGAQVVFYEDNYEFVRNGEASACAFDEPEFTDSEEVAR